STQKDADHQKANLSKDAEKAEMKLASNQVPEATEEEISGVGNGSALDALNQDARKETKRRRKAVNEPEVKAEEPTKEEAAKEEKKPEAKEEKKPEAAAP